jgi:hypothetical protein
MQKLAIHNIEDFYYDVDESVNIHNEGYVGDNNGYNNYRNVTTSTSTDAIMITKISIMERDLSELKEMLHKKDNRCDELQKEVMQLTRQLTAFQVLCARKGLDFEDILKIE